MRNKEIKYLSKFVLPQWRRIIILLCLMTVNSVIALTPPYALKIIIDKAIPSKNYSFLISIILCLLAFYVARSILGVYIDYLSSKLEFKTMGRIKEVLFSNLLQMPYTYFESNKPGDIIQRISQEVDKIQHFLTFGVIRFLNNIFLVVFLMIALCWINPRLFLLTISVIPISIIVNRFLAKKIRKLVKKSSSLEGNLFSHYYDRVQNIKLIKTSFTYTKESLFFKEKLQQLFRMYQEIAISSSVGKNIATFFIALGPLIVFLYGGNQVILGSMSVGALVAYIQYMNRIYAPSNDLSGMYVEYSRVKESAIRIYPILSYTKSKQFNSPNSLSEEIQEIQIRDLFHCYNGSNYPALKNINYTFKKGKKYVIVGENGCGKTTLIKYISKLYSSPSHIIINQINDIHEVSDESWSKKMILLSQDTSLLYDSIYSNLCYGNEKEDHELILKSIMQVGLEEFVLNLPENTKTIVGTGEESVVPSGGQTQLLALGRIFFSNKELILLDEATSAIDAEREQTVLTNIFERSKNNIIIAVSHNLNYILNFDEVVFMEKGEIIEGGNPKELLSQKGAFYKLFESQLN